MNKKLKLGLLISGIGIATLGGGIGIGYAINHSINQPKYYNLEEQKIIKYRTDFLQKQYNKMVEDTNWICSEYGGWKNEYNDVLKKRVNSPYENLDINKKWYEDWQPYHDFDDSNYKWHNNELYLRNGPKNVIIDHVDDNGQIISTETYPLNNGGYLDYIYDHGNCWYIYYYDLNIFQYNINYDENNPETYDKCVATCWSNEFSPIIIYK